MKKALSFIAAATLSGCASGLTVNGYKIDRGDIAAGVAIGIIGGAILYEASRDSSEPSVEKYPCRDANAPLTPCRLYMGPTSPPPP